MKIIIGETTSQVTLEQHRCFSCENWQKMGFKPGMFGGYVTCTTCKGTGNGPRGGKGKCRGCSSLSPGKMLNHNPKVQQAPCNVCGGTALQDETVTSCMSEEVFAQWLPHVKIKVYRIKEEQSWFEQHIGFGLWSQVDYGTSWGMSDEDLKQSILQSSSLRGQLCKLMQRDKVIAARDADKVHTITNKLSVVVKPQGYSLFSDFDV